MFVLAFVSICVFVCVSICVCLSIAGNVTAEIWWIQRDFDLAACVHVVIIRLTAIHVQLMTTA